MRSAWSRSAVIPDRPVLQDQVEPQEPVGRQGDGVGLLGDDGEGHPPQHLVGVEPAHLASASSAGWANRLRLCTHSTAWCRCTTSSPSLSLPAGTVRASTVERPQSSAPSTAGLTEGPVEVGGGQDVGHLARAHVGQDRRVGAGQHLHGPHSHHRERPPLGQHAPQPVQERSLVPQLGLHVERAEAVDGVHERRQVELGEVRLREAAVAVGRPLHGRAHRVPVTEVDVVTHQQLVAVVDDGAARQGQDQGIQQLGRAAVVVEERGQPAPDPHVALHPRVLGVLGHEVVPLLVAHLLERQLVVVAQEDGPLAGVVDDRRLGQDLGDRVALLPADRHEEARHEREVEAQVALVAVAEVVGHVARPAVGLGQQDAPGVVGIDLLADALDERVRLGQVLARRPVALVQVGHRVEPEPVEAEIEPEAHQVDHGVGDFGVLVVEVGLVVVEAVPVVLLAGVVPGPVRALDVGEHDSGVGPLLVVVVPDVPVRLGVVPRRPRLDEPRVLVAGVVHHEVGDDPDAAAVRVLQERHQVADAPVVGVDVEEVADVVAAVAEGRGIERQHPDAVDAQPLHVVELLAQAAQVTGAVVVGVVVAPDEHLVEDGVLEPAHRGVEGALAGADRDRW